MQDVKLFENLKAEMLIIVLYGLIFFSIFDKLFIL